MHLSLVLRHTTSYLFILFCIFACCFPLLHLPPISHVVARRFSLLRLPPISYVVTRCFPLLNLPPISYVVTRCFPLLNVPPISHDVTRYYFPLLHLPPISHVITKRFPLLHLSSISHFVTIVYFTTRGHLFFKISRIILGVEQPYFACPSESICPNWDLNLGFCSSVVKKLFMKSLLKICLFCELDF